MFAYPEKARYGRVIPKTKIFEKASVPSSVRKLFASQVEKLVWEYKLAPDTVNLPERDGVLEIQVIITSLKTPDFDPALLRVLDRSIPHPVFFEIHTHGKAQTWAAYKRPHETNPGEWVVGDYFSSPKRSLHAVRSALPLALDLFGLYESMLRSMMLPAKPDESLRAHVDRMSTFRVAQGEMRSLTSRLRREKQFPRKVDLERELRTLRKAWKLELEATDPGST
jgi:hypothetical protein